jgi:hypothetical protein
MLPLIIFDATVNLYFTLLFVLPLRKLYSYKNTPNSILRTVAVRSFVGSLATLSSSVVNLTVLMILKGEAAWVCLMCCNADILFNVLVLHWVTSKDSHGGSTAGLSLSLKQGGTGKRGGGLTTIDPLGPHSLVDRSDNFGIYGKEAQVTTRISAGEARDDLEEEEFELDSRKGLGRKDGNGSGAKLHVNVARVVEMESGPRLGNEEGEDITDMIRHGGGSSTDYLVGK